MLFRSTSGAGTGTANDTTPATTSGTSSTAVPFAVNTTTAPSAAQSFPTTGGGTATWSNVTLDLTAPGAPSITSVTDNVGSITGGLTSGGRTDDTNLTVRVSLGSTNAVAGDTVQLYNGGAALGTAYTLLAADITNGYADVATGTLTNGTTYTLNAKVIDIAGNASAASSDRKSTRLNSSHSQQSRMPSSA